MLMRTLGHKLRDREQELEGHPERSHEPKIHGDPAVTSVLYWSLLPGSLHPDGAEMGDQSWPELTVIRVRKANHPSVSSFPLSLSGSGRLSESRFIPANIAYIFSTVHCLYL